MGYVCLVRAYMWKRLFFYRVVPSSGDSHIELQFHNIPMFDRDDLWRLNIAGQPRWIKQALEEISMSYV